MANDTELLDAVHSLPEEAQKSVLSYALFLESRLQEEDVRWDESVSDPVKLAPFTRWADQTTAENQVESVDPAKL